MKQLPDLEAMRRVARTGAGFCVIGIGFSLPISVALDNVLLGLAVLLWIASGPTRVEIRSLRGHPLVLAAIVLFALCAAGLFYGEGTAESGLTYLKKYLDLLLVPVFVLLFRDAPTRRAGIRAFEVAMLLTLVASYLLATGVLPWTKPFTANVISGATAFKLQIAHGTFMAVASYLFAERARTGTSTAARVLWGTACGLAAVNVLFMVSGRTGYLVLFALAMVFWWRILGARGLVAAMTALAIAIALAMSGSNNFSDRVRLAGSEARAWEYGAGIGTSIGDRLNFYTTTTRVIREDPLFGVGLGGFPEAYRLQTEGTKIVPTQNPHNQYLLFWAQLGVVGLVAFLVLLWALWRCSRRLQQGSLERSVAQGLLATAIIGSMVNSFLLDHTEGLFFAWMAGLACAQLSENRATEST